MKNGRYAMQQLQDDIQLAGYYGEYWRLGALPATLPDPCATATPALVTGIPLPIQGYDSPATVPSPLSGCLPDANHLAGTDILVIRRVDTTSVPIASAVAAQPYLQAGLLAPAPEFTYVLGTGTDTTVFNLTKRDGTPANLRKYLTDIYFVSPCSVPTGAGSTCTRSDDNGKPIPTLKTSGIVFVRRRRDIYHGTTGRRHRKTSSWTMAWITPERWRQTARPTVM
ncbi:hypothetical protein ACFS07_00270 [Undibacterium arcticum]